MQPLNTNQFYGVHTALVTPMRRGEVAYDDLEKLVDYQLTSGINGLVAVGTTGESPTLSHDEHQRVIAAVASQAGNAVPVLAGTGSNATSEAVELTRQACELDAVAGALVVAPYYNKPNQEGLFQHFSAIAETTDKPIILYSIPGRCVIEISSETCARLYEKYPHVCGIKEAGGMPERVAELRSRLGDAYLILSGDDSQTLPFMSLGAKGVISVASNLLAKDCCAFVNAALANDFAAALELEAPLHAFFHAIFVEPNPVPIKFALARAGIISSEAVRLPLCSLSETNRHRLTRVLEALGK